MPFEPGSPKIRTGIEDIEVVMFDPGPSNENDIQSGKVNPQISMSDSSIEVSSYNLVSRLQEDPEGMQHLLNLQDFLAYVRTRLNNEAIPQP